MSSPTPDLLNQNRHFKQDALVICVYWEVKELYSGDRQGACCLLETRESELQSSSQSSASHIPDKEPGKWKTSRSCENRVHFCL